MIWILLALGLLAWAARTALALSGFLAERARYTKEESCR